MKKEITLHRFTKFFILFADLSLIVRIGILNKYVLPPYGVPLFELLILIAFIIFIYNFYLNGLDTNIKIILNKYGVYLILMGVFLLSGTILGEFIYKPDISTLSSTIKGLLLFVIASIGFILHAYYATSQKFREKALLSMSLVIVMTIFIFIPSLAENLRILGDSNNSLIGFSRNQNILGSLLLIPLIVSIKEMFGLFNRKLVLNWLMFIFTFSLIIWTGSRGTLMASLVAILTFSIFQIYSKTSLPLNKRFLKLVYMGIFIIISMTISFFILPDYIKLMAIDRIFPIVTNYQPTPEKFKSLELQDVLAQIITRNNVDNSLEKSNTIPYQNRQNIWPKALALSIRNPGGIGPEYGRFSKAIFEINNNWTVSHNSFLQAALSGGFALLFLIIMAIAHIIKIILKMKSSTEKFIYVALWIGFIVAIQFNDFLFNIPWIWAVAGLIIGKKIETTDN